MLIEWASLFLNLIEYRFCRLRGKLLISNGLFEEEDAVVSMSSEMTDCRSCMYCFDWDAFGARYFLVYWMTVDMLYEVLFLIISMRLSRMRLK